MVTIAGGPEEAIQWDARCYGSHLGLPIHVPQACSHDQTSAPETATP